MKVSASLTIRDKKTDKLVWRKGRLYRINKSKPRNKGRQG
ncbi:50S ribosomal protein L36 [Candidatus Saccharibacteria bacterium]|jgi:ribosomal protein L36|nr:50S ribosomal protein L36 [Candidatus Saccharibacteria bacterium]